MQLTNHQRAALHLTMSKGFGPAAFGALSFAGGPEAMLELPSDVVTEKLALSSQQAAWAAARDAFRAGRDQRLSRTIDLIARGAQLLIHGDEKYPKSLRGMPDAPIVLHVAGDHCLEALERPCVAVVGTRGATQYGLQAAGMIAGELARRGITVISGAAMGIDSCAHVAALDEGGKTVAVLGAALMTSDHSDQLRARIHREGGGIMSEQLPGMDTHAGTFVQRNRIISALSSIVIVVEGGIQSGARHTADYALEQGRILMAVPGDIGRPQSVCPNQLIKQGARPVTHVDDVLELLGFARREPSRSVEHQAPRPPPRPAAPLTEPLAKVFEAMHGRGEHLADDLANKLGLSAAEIASALVQLELKGLIRRGHGGLYARTR